MCRTQFEVIFVERQLLDWPLARINRPAARRVLRSGELVLLFSMAAGDSNGHHMMSGQGGCLRIKVATD